jgi:hypothetical protein
LCKSSQSLKFYSSKSFKVSYGIVLDLLTPWLETIPGFDEFVKLVSWAIRSLDIAMTFKGEGRQNMAKVKAMLDELLDGVQCSVVGQAFVEVADDADSYSETRNVIIDVIKIVWNEK